jgi:hypothetical protein
LRFCCFSPINLGLAPFAIALMKTDLSTLAAMPAGDRHAP